jgi:glycine/D-amino acid oxidase-like deaminating enzyme
MSADGLQIVGQAGDLDRVFVVTGAGKKGILLSPVMGSMAAALVTGRPEEAPIPPEFGPERFE